MYSDLEEISSRLDALEGKVENLENSTKEDGPKWFTSQAAADYLNYSVGHLRHLAERRVLKCFRPNGGPMRFKKKDLDDYLEKHPKATRAEVYAALHKD
jgi:excisionase family DNA binding protein